MKTTKIDIQTHDATEALGKKLASLIEPGDVIGLRGDLGAGKTYLSRVISKELGVGDDQPVNSPTFTLINEYVGGRLPIYHMDFYRLLDADELYELGIWEYYEGQGVCLIEWFDKFDDLWPEDATMITIELGEGERRTVTVCGAGKGERIVTGLLSGRVHN